MDSTTSNLDAIAQRARASFAAKDAAREKALRLCREVIRHSAVAIRAAHRYEFDESRASVGEARRLLDELRETLAQYPELLFTGFAHDADA